MTTLIHHYQFRIDTHYKKYFLLLWSSGKLVDTINVEDPEVFAALIDMCRNEKPVSYDVHKGLICTAEHEPIGEGEERLPRDEETPPTGLLSDKNHQEPNGTRFRHVNRYRSEIAIADRQFTVSLYLDENLRARVHTECPKLFALLQDTLRNFGNRMVWEHYTGVLRSGIMCIGSGHEMLPEQSAA